MARQDSDASCRFWAMSPPALGHSAAAALTLPACLQDANIPLQQLRSMYTDMVLLIRTLYQECRLVHADLSEYNILVHEVGPGGARRVDLILRQTAHHCRGCTMSLKMSLRISGHWLLRANAAAKRRRSCGKSVVHAATLSTAACCQAGRVRPAQAVAAQAAGCSSWAAACQPLHAVPAMAT